MSTERPILTLDKRKANPGVAETDVSVQVGVFDVQLPSRQFIVHHKVAVLGDVSLTTEFLLRLLHAVGEMSEYDVARFFDFNSAEMAFVVNEAEARAYVSRQGGCLCLTEAGYALFKDGDKPQIYEVQKRYEKVGFDLLALAPCDREKLSDFELALPELEIRDPELSANASKRVPEAFRRFYREIANRRDRDIAEGLKRALYSVDEVVAGDRFSSLVPVVAVSNIRKPGDSEPRLDSWRSGYEINDRSPIVHAVGAFLDNLKVDRRPEDEFAYQVLVDLAPDYLKDFMTRNGLSVLRYFKETATRAGNLREDRKTVGVVGPLYSPDNSRRISDAIKYAKPRTQGPDDVFLWLMPSQEAWGASRAFVRFLDKIKEDGVDQVYAKDKLERTPIAIGCGRPVRHLGKSLPKVFERPNNGAIPSAVEMLLVPQRMVAVTVHSTVTEARGFPVPLGILSFDPNTVKRAHDYLESQLPAQLSEHGTTKVCDFHTLVYWDNQEG